MRKVAKKVCKLSLFSQLSAPIKSGVIKEKASEMLAYYLLVVRKQTQNMQRYLFQFLPMKGWTQRSTT